VGSRTLAHVHHGAIIDNLTLQVRGRHMVANATAAFVVARLAGIDRYAPVRELADFVAAEGRGEATRLGPEPKPLLLIDESYNANVASMNAAMEVFSGISAPGGQKVLILGDMLELGPQGGELHQSLRPSVLATGAQRIFLVGKAIEPLAVALGPELVTGQSRRIEDLLDTILQSLAFGDAVMVKGSKGVRLALLVDKIKQRFGVQS
jgi:UDP-N-acetylmuramoyl-tripeptide--D-alanyl-D-alanine ligase